VVGGDADVRRAGGDQAEHRADDAADRGHFPSRGVFRRREGIVVAEQLVGAVDQVNVQKSSHNSVTAAPEPAKIDTALTR
jgi:hypothetical protein